MYAHLSIILDSNNERLVRQPFKYSGDFGECECRKQKLDFWCLVMAKLREPCDGKSPRFCLSEA